ncbi:MAG: sugar transferase [Clostridia bacterium]|nr:sugar transferase [Clostridia bacterium]
MYKYVIKRFIDIILSGIAIVLLAIPMLTISIAIKIDDSGPVLFKQKRIGENKNGQISYFMMWKFRSMKADTPHDIPTHLLDNPEQYITRVGKFIRKTSLDELPQIYQVFVGKISCIGPRPGLWNQVDLWEEREKYGANNVKPGITGWAQVNGRDELEIPIKAKFDGEYTERLNAGKFKGLAIDVKCLLKTVKTVVKSSGVVEGSNHELGVESEETKAELTSK